MTLTECLRRAGVSRNAYYSLSRKDSVLPDSINALSRALRVQPEEFMELDNPAVTRMRRIANKAEGFAREHGKADPENIRHTLIILDMPPVERLRRALLRGTKP